MDENGLQELAEQMGILVNPTQAWELLFHLDAVLRANETLNLTAIDDRREAIILHIADSLTALPEVNAAPEGPIVDIGAGAGYPGIPLAIVSERPTTLLEARTKKATFLGMVASALDHEIEVSARRAEELAQEVRGEYAVATARAVGELAELVELAAPLLMPGGSLVAMKGIPEETEIRRGETAAAIVGLSPVSRRAVSLPEADHEREILVFRKTHESSVELPRRPGMARKRPLE